MVKSIEATQHIFQQVFSKAEKMSKLTNLANPQRFSESPFKTTAVRNLEYLEALERLFPLKLAYNIYRLVL